MRKRLRTVMFGIGLMILLAQPAFAEELGQANITPRTKMAEIRSNPSVVGAGIYTYSLDQDRVLDRMYWDAQPLSCLSNHWTAQDAADGLNYLIRTYNAGQRVTFPLYTAEEIAQTIESSGLSRFPVYEEDADDIIGILNTRDWLLNARKASPRPVRELLRPAYFVPESVRTDKLFRDMQSRKIHLSIVVDEYGGTAGLVTMEDLLEEIVGNIYDEFDPQEDQEIIALGDNRWRIAGSAELDDVAEALDMEFPEDEESETLGGLVFAQLNVIPEDGSHPEVELYGLHIRVEELTDRRVEWATVTKLAPSESEEDAE